MSSHQQIKGKYTRELQRAVKLSASHDEMKRILKHVILPEFQELTGFLARSSMPCEVKSHGHGVILNFGKPNKPYTIAYYGYPEDGEFELAITVDDGSQEPPPSEESQRDEILRTALNRQDNQRGDIAIAEEDLLDFGFPDVERSGAIHYRDKAFIEEEINGVTNSRRIKFVDVLPVDIKLLFENFLFQYIPELSYTAPFRAYELYDINHSGPYELRLEDEGATSVIAVADSLERVISIGSELASSFQSKGLIITDGEGYIIC